jgi:hypothetical protein
LVRYDDGVTEAEKHQKLTELAKLAIAHLRELPAPVARVSGPLTSGGYGFAENTRRFALAQARLRAEGYTVFDYFGEGYDERQLVALDLPWEVVMEYYHRPILETKLITTVFMLPRWETSNGARFERELAEALGLEIRELAEGWVEEGA